ncbi:recombinase family protein [Shewanella maritima]|uniref:Recombinase family protein n=1 Tax=Shewanella maritima TaxID=2520507 RepID=A0A411PKI9_9GAMM|nr:recombinase family protein [Shewanella maritima]QBF84038.1 recombinase family protein [Shewanella maritima]
MQLADSYVRFSSKGQAKGHSLERQQQDIQAYCTKAGLTLSDSNYQDLGVSAFTSANADEDKGLGQYLVGLREQLVTSRHLIVESLDRLSRAKVVVALSQFTQILSYGVSIHTIMDGKVYTADSDPADIMFSLMIMMRANEESEVKSKRLKSSWDRKRTTPTASKKNATCPWWLTLNEDGQTYTVDEAKAEIIRELFQRCINGDGGNKLAQYLNSTGYKTARGKAWGLSSTSYQLNTKAVIGIWEPHIYEDGKRKPTGEQIENYYPPIMEPDFYWLAQARRDERKRPSNAGRKGAFLNIFSKITVCPKCGSGLHFLNKGKLKSGKLAAYLACAKQRVGECDQPILKWQKALDFIEQVYLAPFMYQHWQQPKAKPQENKLESLQAQLTKEQTELNNLLISIGSNLNSVISNQISQRSEKIAHLESTIEAAQREQAELLDDGIHQQREDAYALFRRCTADYSDDTYQDRQQLNRMLSKAFGKVAFDVESNKATIEKLGMSFDYLDTGWCVSAETVDGWMGR